MGRSFYNCCFLIKIEEIFVNERGEIKKMFIKLFLDFILVFKEVWRFFNW